MRSTLVTLATALIVAAALEEPQQVLSSAPQCPIDIPISCTNSTPIVNSCCFESPGGMLLQTQFWNYNPAFGPDDEFTIHGLWPDRCDGTYDQFCRSELQVSGRQIKDIVVNKFKDQKLYDGLKTTWKSNKGDDDDINFWAYEFNKHATCLSTILPTCYGAFKDGENVYDYFSVVYELFENLPTYKWLGDAGIVPSNTQTYTKKQIADALSSKFGEEVYFNCDHNHAINEIHYFHHIRGSLLQRNFIPLPAKPITHDNKACPNEGIKFPPKGSRGPQPTHTRPGEPGPVPTGTPSAGYIRLEDHAGCLISNGHWFTSGTCATYHFIDLQYGGTSIKSTKGYCGFDDKGQFTCNRSIDGSKFHFSVKEGNVGYGGKFDWCLNKKGSTGEGPYKQTPVILADGKCESFKLYVETR
ncbi:uncharacterized protein SPAPADRAFT_141979 [Spathaspora passalidarum NRRL Y-27907]|uniref:Ribonuclease T2-like n=1 Tax=Spathaspora passalidarum (strain NRRL Y-27907 / 11-Y1) TaxID=619300 RepID=G3ASG0_SPAPN|nr:uncharacterized protein SPAPADRAFT_141979 [Spathaspora passalidarum NRRL Y-27907]EGW31078.1 hypothetical protein SPAPADRAFT_141979 [Spathaspora passalidarum NRRL Y-27907]